MNHGSLFSGIGGFDLAAQWMGWNNVFHCEINEFARRTLKYYWPKSIDYENIRTTDFTIHRGNIDVLSGGFPCFTEDVKVKTIDGYKKIKDIVIGDLVLTHEGRYMPVTFLMNKENAEIWEIKSQGLYEPIKTTEEHPFYVKKQKNSIPEWVNIKDIEKGDYVGYRINDDCTIDIKTKEFWYLVGRYLGDGWIQNQQRKPEMSGKKINRRINSKVWKVIICTCKDDMYDLYNKIIDAGFKPTISVERTVVKFIINSKEFVEFLQPFGKYAYGKTLPGYCSRLTLDRQQALFEGWMDADGFIDKNGVYKVTSVSEELIISMAEIARNVFKRPVSISKSVPNRTCIIEGRVVNERISYRLSVSNSERYGFYENGFLWCLVKKINKTSNKEKVYNISVHEDETYTANGITVHNCQPFSTAGRRKGTEDTRYLWPEMLRAIREIRPKWVVGENVYGLISWDGGLVLDQVCSDLENEGFEILPIVLPAAGVNAPHKRDRIFFVARRKEADVIENTNISGRIHGESEEERTEVWQQRDFGTRGSDGIHLSEGVSSNTNNTRDSSQEFGVNQEREEKEQKQLRLPFTEFGGLSDAWDSSAAKGKELRNEKDRKLGRTITNTIGIGGLQDERRDNRKSNEFNEVGETRVVTNTNTQRWEERNISKESSGQKFVSGGLDEGERGSNEEEREFGEPRNWDNFPTQSPVCGGDDGISTRLDGIAFSKWRNESIKGYGNAIVPQVVIPIFKVIQKLEIGE